MAVPAHSDDVIIVGAGPTGLLLAAELALAGVRCRVLERRAGLRTDSRAICLHARSMETLDLRGQAETFAAAGLTVPAFPLGPRGAQLRFGRLDSDFPYLLDIPQSQMERLLSARAAELGARICWSSEVTAISQDADGVTVGTACGGSLRAAYAVACDGIRSFVRQALGLPFPGQANPGSVILADLHLDGLPMSAAYGDLSGGGMLLMFPFRDGSCRVVLYDYSRADVPVSEPVTLGEVAAGLRRITGRDFGPRDMYWSGRYRSESRQVPAYRSGRVLLAGDAAHSHSPAGAQGLNTGLQDAANLGWKLGAVTAGWAPGWLLDSYHAERHPVGRRVLALTGRQFRLNTARTPARRALRWGVHRMIVPLPPVQTRLARDYAGLSIRYPPPASSATGAGPAHPLTGARLPPVRLTLADGSGARGHELLHAGRFVLLIAASPPGRGQASAAPRAPAGLGPAAGGGLPRPVTLVRYRERSGAALPPAVLVRPDGYLAWACADPDPAARAAAARAAAAAWCSPGR